jgi:hypothetical protein
MEMPKMTGKMTGPGPARLGGAGERRLSRSVRRLGSPVRSVTGCFYRWLEFLYITRERVLLVNVASGALIAVSVYYFSNSGLSERWLSSVARLAELLREGIASRNSQPVSLAATLTGYGAVIVLSAGFCTYADSLRRIVVLNAGLMLLVLLLGRTGALDVRLPLGTLIVVALIVVGALLDHAVELRRLKRSARALAARQETEHMILRQISHSINPTIQMALSPVAALVQHLAARHQLDDVLARRRDGSDETVGEALEAALVSMRQIREVMETTENLFGGRIGPAEFTPVSLQEVFEREILPLFPERQFAINLRCDPGVEVSIHVPSFVQAMKNIIRNAQVHGFSPGLTGRGEPFVLFEIRTTVKEVMIDAVNNGLPFPQGVQTSDYLAFGKKGKNSPGKGLGGAWVDKFVALHNGEFRKVSNDPVHLRITLPRRRL